MVERSEEAPVESTLLEKQNQSSKLKPAGFFWLFFLFSGVLLGLFFFQFLPLLAQAKRANALEKELQLVQEKNRDLETQQLDLQERLRKQDEAWTQFSKDVQNAQNTASAQKTVSTSASINSIEKQEPNPFVFRFNQLLAREGVLEWKLFEAGTVQDGTISSVILHRIGSHGALSGSIFAKQMRLSFTQNSESLYFDFFEGEVFENGAKFPISEEGYRIELAQLHINRWKEVLPELFLTKTQNTNSSAKPVSNPALGTAIERINQLLESKKSNYRFLSLGSASRAELNQLQLEQLNVTGQQERILRAAVGKLRFDAAQQTAELILEKGIQEKDGKVLPLPASGFRILLPEISEAEWNAARR